MVVACPGQHPEQPRQIRHVSHNQNSSVLAREASAYPLWRIVREQAPLGGEWRQWIADLPEDLRCLARPKLSAVPDRVRLDAARHGVVGKFLRCGDAHRRQRTHWIDLRTDRVTVMNEDDMHMVQYRGPLAPVSYTHLRAHETPEHLVCRLLLEKK